jgi:hypothetical protein
MERISDLEGQEVDGVGWGIDVVGVEEKFLFYHLGLHFIHIP